MDKVIFLKKEYLDGIELEHAIIDHGNDEFTSMLKSDYDAMKADEAKIK